MIAFVAFVTLVGIAFLAYAYKRKWFFLSVVDEEHYERNKPLFK